ncbi:hypothetical protein Tco_0988803 [Tanacetum coccineum]|uniref:Uncharacterized protein n=1 Tax=Tanacetum coccineum TaxID=301880 RepID=A0ABQ5ES38_9ASTR
MLQKSLQNLQTGRDLTKVGEKLGTLQESLNVAYKTVAPLQSLSNCLQKHLRLEINRRRFTSVSSSLMVQKSESLQRKLVDLLTKLSFTNLKNRMLSALLNLLKSIKDFAGGEATWYLAVEGGKDGENDGESGGQRWRDMVDRDGRYLSLLFYIPFQLMYCSSVMLGILHPKVDSNGLADSSDLKRGCIGRPQL